MKLVSILSEFFPQKKTFRKCQITETYQIRAPDASCRSLISVLLYIVIVRSCSSFCQGDALRLSSHLRGCSTRLKLSSLAILVTSVTGFLSGEQQDLNQTLDVWVIPWTTILTVTLYWDCSFSLLAFLFYLSFLWPHISFFFDFTVKELNAP